MNYVATIGEQEISIAITSNGQICDLSLTDSDTVIDCIRVAPSLYSVILDGKSYLLQVHKNQQGFEVLHRNQPVKVLLKDEVDLLREKYGMGDIAEEMHGMVQAPIPGLVVDIQVREGDFVEQGAGLMVLEAMKMENEITAPIAGEIWKIHVEEGQNIEKDTLLIEIEPEQE